MGYIVYGLQPILFIYIYIEREKHIYIYIYIYICIYIYTYIYLYIYIYCAYLYIYIYIYINKPVYVHICMSVNGEIHNAFNLYVIKNTVLCYSST